MTRLIKRPPISLCEITLSLFRLEVFRLLEMGAGKSNVIEPLVTDFRTGIDALPPTSVVSQHQIP